MKKLSELEDLGVSEISEESKIKMPTPTNRDVRKESLAAAVYLNYFQKSHFKDRSISGHPSIGLHPHREKLPTRPASQGHRGQGLRLRGQA